VIGWLTAAAVTVTAFFRARRELAEPRPGLWAMRLMLIHRTDGGASFTSRFYTYFGTQHPSQQLIQSAQQELDRLQVPSA
jgi:hypothetical protein